MISFDTVMQRYGFKPVAESTWHDGARTVTFNRITYRWLVAQNGEMEAKGISVSSLARFLRDTKSSPHK